MLIPIADADGELLEWALVELQGKIEPQRDIDLEESLTVGTLQLSKTNQDIVQLQIGYHILEGKRLPLKKPMAIIEKQADNSGSSSSQVVCKVVGIVRHKYLFKTRPKALISKPSGRRH